MGEVQVECEEVGWRRRSFAVTTARIWELVGRAEGLMGAWFVKLLLFLRVREDIGIQRLAYLVLDDHDSEQG